MTLEEALRIAAQAVFLWVAFITLLLWLRKRDRTRRDIFFVFLVFAIAIFAQELAPLFPGFAPALNSVLLISLLAQPYLVLRVARYMLPVPGPVHRAAFVGLVSTTALVLLDRSGLRVATVLVVVYFLLVEAYATFLLLRGARTIPGMTGKRLGLASLGSGLLALAFLIVFAQLLLGDNLSENLSYSLSISLQILTIFSGLAYFLGFAPPRWLRRAWQLEVLHDFLRELSGNTQQPAFALQNLTSAGMRAVSGAGAVLARSNDDGHVLSFEAPSLGTVRVNDAMKGTGDTALVWRAMKSAMVRLPADVESGVAAWAARMNSQTLYLVPVVGTTRSWGMLLVALRYVPLFAEDDLSLLDLLCEQTVTHINQDELVEKLQAANRELEQRIVEQTRSEEKFWRLLESAPDGMVIIDDTGTILMSNAQAGRHFGCQSGDLAGRQLVDLLSPESRPAFREHYMALLREPTDRPVIINTEMKALRSDGSPFPAEVSLNPIITREGTLTIVAVHDLTRRFRAEQKFRGLLESAPDAVIVVDKDGLIQLVNKQAEKMFGYERQDLLGNSIEILVPRRFQKKHIKHRDGYYVEHPTRPMGAGLDLHAVRRDGSEFPVEISLSPLEIEEDLLISAAVRDVTERRQIEEKIRELNTNLELRAAQLEAANKELESFSYSVSHDLRAPLRSIDGFSQALLEDYSDQIPEAGLSYLQRVRSAAQRMAELIDDLLNLSRVTRAALKPRFMNLSQVAEDVVARLRELEPNRNLQVSITPDLMVTGDPHLLRIVMDNLLSNAWKFTSRREQAIIEFGQLEKVKERTFFIRDNGVGFNMAYVDKLFGVFQRLHSVTDYPGTGVGLATVHRIITMHGGRIWAESQEGQGTTFFFTL